MNDIQLKTLLSILGDGKFHSGATIGSTLGITRSGIWKLIGQLKTLQIEVEAKTREGYRIPNGIELLSLKKIKPFVDKKYRDIINATIILDETDSTNTYLLQEIASRQNNVSRRVAFTPEPLICLAERQTAARGRFGRPWIAPFGKNIYLSVAWQFNCDLSELSGLSLAVAVAIARALQRYGINTANLKWPNDVLWQQRKIAGTLIELRSESHATTDAVIGIGLNVDMPMVFRELITTQMVDVAEIIQKIPERNRLTGLLINELLSCLTSFQATGLTSFMNDWQALDCAYLKSIVISSGNNMVRGISQGIDEQGRLLLKTDDGELLHFASGEVSLRFQKT